MTVRHHTTHHTDTDACGHDTAHTIVSGYATYRNANRYVDTHLAPRGHAYVVTPTPGTPAWAETYDVVCTPLAVGYDHDGRTVADGAPTPLATRYGVAITTVDPARSYVETSDRYGYAAPMPGHDTYDAPTVPATTDTPTDRDDLTTADGVGMSGVAYAATHAHARGVDGATSPGIMVPSDADIAADDARRADPYAWATDTATPASGGPTVPVDGVTADVPYVTGPVARPAHTWATDRDDAYTAYIATGTGPSGYDDIDRVNGVTATYTTVGSGIDAGRVPMAAITGYGTYDYSAMTYVIVNGTDTIDAWSPGSSSFTVAPINTNADHTPALPPNATTVDGRTVVAARNAVHVSPVGAPTPHGVTPHTGTHTEIGYTGHVCTVAAGVTITYTYTDASPDGYTYDRTIIGRVGAPVGMAMLGNAGYAITDTDGTVTYVSRLAMVTIIAPDTYASDVVGLVALHTDDDDRWDGCTTCNTAPCVCADTAPVATPMSWPRTYTCPGCGHTVATTERADHIVYACTDPMAAATTPTTDPTPRDVRTDGTMRVYGPVWGSDTYATVTYNTLDRTYTRDGMTVSSLAWSVAGGESCGHSVAAYGACVAPLNHPLHAHVDASGHRFAGTRLSPYASPIGCDTPATMTRVVCRMPFQRDTYRTTLTVDAALMAHTYMTAWGIVGDGTYGPMMRAYRSLVADACGDMMSADMFADDIYDAFLTDITTPATYTSPARIPYTA